MTRTTTIIQGVLAGIYGAGCMSVLRMAVRRAGVIDATPPQETKRWLAETTGIAPRHVAAHQVLDTLIHLAVGGGAGAMYGALVAPAVRPNLAGGAGFGLAFWAAAFGVVMPALGITRSLRRSTERRWSRCSSCTTGWTPSRFPISASSRTRTARSSTDGIRQVKDSGPSSRSRPRTLSFGLML